MKPQPLRNRVSQLLIAGPILFSFISAQAFASVKLTLVDPKTKKEKVFEFPEEVKLPNHQTQSNEVVVSESKNCGGLVSHTFQNNGDGGSTPKGRFQFYTSSGSKWTFEPKNRNLYSDANFVHFSLNCDRVLLVEIQGDGLRPLAKIFDANGKEITSWKTQLDHMTSGPGFTSNGRYIGLRGAGTLKGGKYEPEVAAIYNVEKKSAWYKAIPSSFDGNKYYYLAERNDGVMVLFSGVPDALKKPGEEDQIEEPIFK